MPSFSAAVLLAALVAAAPAGAPDVAPGPSPAPLADLKVIGRVRAITPFCKSVFAHTSAAVDSAFTNDARLALDESWLSGVQLDQTVLQKENGVHNLSVRAVELTQSAKKGISELDALRAEAKSASISEQQRQDVDGLADALAGALQRQMNLAKNMSSLVAYLEIHPQIDEWQNYRNIAYAAFNPAPWGGVNHSWDPKDQAPPTLSEAAGLAADELKVRQAKVFKDEATAAGFAPAVVKECGQDAAVPEASP